VPDLLAILAIIGFFAAAGAFARWLDRLERGGSP
jgi:hypothetical protein